MINKKWNRVIILVLTITLLLSQTILPVWGTGAEDFSEVIIEQDYEQKADVIKTETFSGNNETSEDIEAGAESETSAESEAGAESEVGDDNEPSDDAKASDDNEDKDQITIEQEEESTSEIMMQENKHLQLLDRYGNEKVFSILYNSYSMPSNGAVLTAAVWSDENGQDDLKWYEMSAISGGYKAELQTGSHKTCGTYQVHVYLRQKDGKMIFLEKGTFNVSAVTADSIEIIQDEKDLSKAQILIHGVTCPSGVTTIVLPVWSRSDQKDLYWYTAVKKDENTWSVDLSYSNHKDSSGGIFQIHVYGTNGIGVQKYILNSTVKMEKGKPLVSAEPSTEGLKLSLENCTDNNPKEVRFAVWSENNGQDDLKWYTTTKGSNGKYSVIMPYPTESGYFQIHCYIKNAAGKLVFQKGLKYEIGKPSAGSISVQVSDSKDGTFIMTISDISYPDQIKEITVPVWCAADQSDLVWYKAEKQSDGTWTAKGSIFNHKGNSGIYQAHVYVKAYSNISANTCRTSFAVEKPETEVTAGYSADGKSLNLKASNISLSEGVREVRFAVWSSENGQDDLKWYTVSGSNGVFTASAPLVNHPGKGMINIHAYAVSKTGKMYFVKSTDFKVDLEVDCSIHIMDFSEDSFSADMFIDCSSESMNIKKVEIAAWSADGQSDLYWYQASKSAGNSWYAAFSPLKHQGNTGTFQLHVYVTFQNGTRVFAGKTEYSVRILNQLYITENPDGTVTATCYSIEDMSSVSVAVWSDENGQDDLKWYKMTKKGNCYSTVLSINNHKHNGVFLAHFYGNNRFLGSKNFSFPESIGKTESIAKVPEAGKSDVKFFNGKIISTQNGTQLTLLNIDGSIYKKYPGIDAYWFNVLESENLIVYSNYNFQLRLLKLDADYNVVFNKIITTSQNHLIDPTIIKTEDQYLVTATEIIGTVNNSDSLQENGRYTISSWTSTNLINWWRGDDIITDNYNIEDVDVLFHKGILYLVYEKEVLDKGNSSIMVKTSYDNGRTWNDPIELLPADSDHEPALLAVNGDRFILFYSSDKDNTGSSYNGAKAYYAMYDSNLNCITKDIEIETSASGGILWYDVTWIDSTHYILYAENYMTSGTLVVEKAK